MPPSHTRWSKVRVSSVTFRTASSPFTDRGGSALAEGAIVVDREVPLPSSRGRGLARAYEVHTPFRHLNA